MCGKQNTRQFPNALQTLPKSRLASFAIQVKRVKRLGGCQFVRSCRCASRTKWPQDRLVILRQSSRTGGMAKKAAVRLLSGPNGSARSLLKRSLASAVWVASAVSFRIGKRNMPTVQTMPKATVPNVARATRVEKMHQPHRNPGPVLSKSDPRQRGSKVKQSRPVVAISPSPQSVAGPKGSRKPSSGSDFSSP